MLDKFFWSLIKKWWTEVDTSAGLTTEIIESFKQRSMMALRVQAKVTPRWTLYISWDVSFWDDWINNDNYSLTVPILSDNWEIEWHEIIRVWANSSLQRIIATINQLANEIDNAEKLLSNPIASNKEEYKARKEELKKAIENHIEEYINSIDRSNISYVMLEDELFYRDKGNFPYDCYYYTDDNEDTMDDKEKIIVNISSLFWEDIEHLWIWQRIQFKVPMTQFIYVLDSTYDEDWTEPIKSDYEDEDYSMEISPTIDAEYEAVTMEIPQEKAIKTQLTTEEIEKEEIPVYDHDENWIPVEIHEWIIIWFDEPTIIENFIFVFDWKNIIRIWYKDVVFLENEVLF